MQEAAQEAGAPADLFQSMSRVSVAGTDALMRHHRTDLVLATGSRAMVLAAYSSGKPTYAVGPGNVPGLHPRLGARHRLRGALHHGGQDLRLGHGLRLRAVGHRRPLDRGRRCRRRWSARARSSSPTTQQNQLTQLLFPQGGRGASNVEAVSQSPATLAHLAGFSIPEGTQLLVVRPGGIGYDFPLSREILGPGLQVHRGRGPRRGHRDRGRAAALRRRRAHLRRARAATRRSSRATPRPRRPTACSSTRRRCSARWATRPASTARS